MFELSTSSQSVWANNNIFYTAPVTAGDTPTLFEFATNQGNMTFGQNWVSPGWLSSESAELGESYDGTITGTNNFYTDPTNTSPFVSLSGDNYQLSSTSTAIGIAGSLDSSWPAVTEEYVAPQSETARTSIADDGAYQATSLAPAVTSETPAANATGVAVSTTVTATFNQAVQSGTITFTLTTSAGTSIAGNLSYNSSTDTATFTPSAALAYDTTYTATVSGAENSSGTPMSSAFSWSFTTDPLQPAVSSYTPASGATGVAVSTTPTATFNEAVQSSTISFALDYQLGDFGAGDAVLQQLQ